MQLHVVIKFKTMIASLLPTMIIFDLDFVLWPFWIDTHVTSPFFGKGEKIVDATGQRISCYPEVQRILEMLDRRGIGMSAVARVKNHQGANQLIDSFDWSKFFTYSVIHPGAVTNHIKELHLVSGIPYNEMLYFNDEPRDLHQVERMGVLTHLVRNNGLDLMTLRGGFDRYEKNKTGGPFSPAYKPRYQKFSETHLPSRSNTYGEKRPYKSNDRLERLFKARKSEAAENRPYRPDFDDDDRSMSNMRQFSEH